MEPTIGRIAFQLGLTVLILALIPLPLLIVEPRSPEFIVDLIAITVTVVFLLAVVWDVRRQSRKYVSVNP